MRIIASLLFVCLVIMAFSSRSTLPDDHVEFVCMKKHIATKTCHYNFKVDGAKYRYVDIGCKFKKTKEVIERAKAGELALAKDWVISCPETKE